jgi:hypothetical protein
MAPLAKKRAVVLQRQLTGRNQGSKDHLSGRGNGDNGKQRYGEGIEDLGLNGKSP